MHSTLTGLRFFGGSSLAAFLYTLSPARNLGIRRMAFGFQRPGFGELACRHGNMKHPHKGFTGLKVDDTGWELTK